MFGGFKGNQKERQKQQKMVGSQEHALPRIPVVFFVTRVP